MEHAQQAHMWTTLSPVGCAIGEVIETLRPHWRKWILGRGGETRPLGMYFIPGPFLYLSLSLFPVHHETNNPSTISSTTVLFCLTIDCRLQSLKSWTKTILPESCFSQGLGHSYSEKLAEFIRTQHHSQEGFGEPDTGLMLTLFSPEAPF